METVRGWFTGIWASTTPKYEDVLQREAKTMDWYRDGADDVKARQRIDNDPIERERPVFNTRNSLVELQDRNNMFIPGWKALYLEKQGKLARVGVAQHVEIDEPTHWTRVRSANKAADEAGTFVPN